MLRLYSHIEHEIYKLHEMVEHLVCTVWCNADEEECEPKLSNDFKVLYRKYKWLKEEVDSVYEKCKALTKEEREAIIGAFSTNNNVEELCNGAKPIYLDELPRQVKDDMKPLLVDFYEKLLERGNVPGTKKDYYNKLIKENRFNFCPGCGLIRFESEDSKYREAFDHYLPKARYPFASVNFLNLVPLCFKCNSDRKKIKDPIEGGRKTFYPFSKGKNTHKIKVKLDVDWSKDIDKLEREDVKVNLIGDKEKVETWDWLFDISERYNDTIRDDIAKSLHRMIVNRHFRNKERGRGDSLKEIIDDYVYDYELEPYSDANFLKSSFLEVLKDNDGLMNVYE